TVSVEAQAETCRSQRELWQRKPLLTAPTAGKSVESLMTTRRLHTVLLPTICQILSRLHKRACERFFLHTDYTRQQARLSRFLEESTGFLHFSASHIFRPLAQDFSKVFSSPPAHPFFLNETGRSGRWRGS